MSNSCESDNITAKRESSNSTISTNSDYENYTIKTNVCLRLSQELNLEEHQYDDTDYDPPEESGLENCNMIIPEYYQIARNIENAYNIDYYEMIQDDIRNFRALNKYQLEYIKTLSHEQKNELIELFNISMQTFIDFL